MISPRSQSTPQVGGHPWCPSFRPRSRGVARQRSHRPRLEVLEDRLLLSSSVPALSSLPGAPATLFLDFDGHYEAEWVGYSSVSTPAYDIDGNASSFSAAELDNIARIWRAVAEDYSPFNL